MVKPVRPKRSRGRPRTQSLENEAATVQALDRGLMLLSALAKEGEVTLSELALRVGMPPSSAHRLLVTLQKHGIVDFEVQIRTNNFDTPHAHNAWVDAWLELGPLGALLLTAIILRGLFWSTRRIRAVPTAIGMYSAAIISLAVIYSTTEAGFITRSIQFIMFVVALTEAARQKGIEQPFVASPDRSDSTEMATVTSSGFR